MTVDFFEQIEKQLRRMPDHTVFRYLASDGRREAFTYRRVVQEAGKISLFLQCEGIRPGDAVGILMENHPRWGIAFLAAQSAGARTVPLDVEQECQTLARLIEHAECKFLVSSARLAPKLTEIQKLLEISPNFTAGRWRRIIFYPDRPDVPDLIGRLVSVGLPA